MSRIVWVLATLVVCVAPASAPAATPLRRIAVVLEDRQPETAAIAASGLTALGGRVTHVFDQLLVAEVPAGSELRAYRLRGIRDVMLNAASGSSQRGSASAIEIAGWNGIARIDSDTDSERFALETPQMSGDALTPPDVSIESVRAASAAAAAFTGRRRSRASPTTFSSGAPYGATELNTSEFLAGRVSVNVILVESDGSHELSTENWTATREGEVVGKVVAGMEWLRLQEPQASLQFAYHVYAGRTDPRARTGYEPIRRAADPNGGSGEDLWVKEVLGKFGYTSGDRFARSRAFAADTRGYDGSDWAVNVFVVDSLADADGKFADGRFAYTWIGGPHVVMTYDNQTWGISRMDMVLRHELLHAFYSFDEYIASACTCTEHRGYLDGLNTNCDNCNVAAAACVMIANGDAMCGATRRQIGWADLDGDGVIDVIGQDPDTFLDTRPAATCTVPELSGLASVTAATNRNPSMSTPRASISINKIAAVEVRIDQTVWLAADPEGAGWGAPQSRFTATFPLLVPGEHHLEARAVDDHGNFDLQPAQADVLVYPPVAPLGSTVRASKEAASAVVMSWDACSGAKAYRIYRRTSPAAGESLAAETSETVWADPVAGTAYYQVRPVDGCGAERAD
jgi:hypothetical protein